MINKVIIFDSSTLITLAMNGLLEELKNLKKIFMGEFIVTKEVIDETINRPLKIKRFELEAIKLKKLLEEKILEKPVVLGIEDSEISKKTDVLMSIANTTFEGKGKNIHIIDLGEASCLALSKILNKKNIKNIIAVDERTTRVLCEKPENLKELLQKKLKIPIKENQENYFHFKEFKFIRSSELIYVAYKKKLIRWAQEKNILDALLYSLKFKGCAISNEEIEEIKKLDRNSLK